jgi:Cd2+/Zn2+-exporting ATPase
MPETTMPRTPEKTVKIDIPLLLPEVEDDKDGCLHRLELALRGVKGISRAHIKQDNSHAELCLHYDPNLISLADVRHKAEHAGAKITSRYQHDLVAIQGMDCSDCVRIIEHSLERMPGVLTVSVSYPGQKMRIEYDRQKIKRTAIDKRLNSLGYHIPLEGLQNWLQKNFGLVISLASGIFLLSGWLMQAASSIPLIASTILYSGAAVLGGWNVFPHAWSALKQRYLDTDVLMLLAALGAASIGKFSEAALLLFLFGLGHALEGRLLDRARAAIHALSDLAPKTALVRRYDEELEIPMDQIALEDTVIVAGGARIPADGVILKGSTSVNQAALTGESLPVDKSPGDKVYAGTLNGRGSLEIEVTRLTQDSTLARVIKLVEEAQTQKSPTQQVTERFERFFVPAVLASAILLILVPPVFGVPFQQSFLRAMTLLVAASPCALALGTPAAVLAGIAQAARNGIMIKGGAHLENLGGITVMAFDKTGTLTLGTPMVSDILPWRGFKLNGNTVDWVNGEEEQTKADLLNLVASLESRSNHPLAQAVMRDAQSRNLPLLAMDQVESLSGMGMRARLPAGEALVGSAKLMKESGIPLSEEVQASLDELESHGKTVVLAAIAGQLIGTIGLADMLRPNARQTIAALAKLGISQAIMLTGDNESVARTIANQAGLSGYHASLLPEDKLDLIQQLTREQNQVAMVGDGINDAPALANATVGIAMGSAGNDVALESADIALMGNDLMKLPYAIGLGRATRRVIVQNLTIALGVIAGLSLSALSGWVGIGIAIAFHEGSTLLVILNALRLLGFRQPK